ncbi:MAG: fluoride efflux transporter CrcB [Bacteroides sp.]|nr:fluoride efflux transporter CrcB [Bacteroidales bacterium]MBD5296243.1 fluoride efflux transporter CrcB [Bacteroides sp.]MDE6235860.1 fluoride efflux transporter CrcB [Muribaculaceae bacterium]
MFKNTMIAGAGGFLGTCLRFLSEKLGHAICYLSFPLGTFMANMVGCIIIGMLYGYLNKTGKLSKTANLLWITGFCGGLTTFSSFSDEMISLLQGGQSGMFVFYMVTSLVFGIAMVALGAACIRKPAAKTQNA